MSSGGGGGDAGVRAMAGDLERRCGAEARGDVARRLLEEGRLLAALRYVQRHKIASVSPAVFVGAAAALDDPVTYAAVYRFCADNVPDFQTMPDFAAYQRMLLRGRDEGDAA